MIEIALKLTCLLKTNTLFYNTKKKNKHIIKNIYQILMMFGKKQRRVCKELKIFCNTKNRKVD